MSTYYIVRMLELRETGLNTSKYMNHPSSRSVSSLVRVAHKHQVKSVLDDAMARIKAYYPDDLESHGLDNPLNHSGSTDSTSSDLRASLEKILYFVPRSTRHASSRAGQKIAMMCHGDFRMPRTGA